MGLFAGQAKKVITVQAMCNCLLLTRAQQQSQNLIVVVAPFIAMAGAGGELDLIQQLVDGEVDGEVGD